MSILRTVSALVLFDCTGKVGQRERERERERERKIRRTFKHPAAVQVGRQVLAGGSLLRSAQTQVGEPKIGEPAQ
jgi:hypothetical protein